MSIVDALPFTLTNGTTANADQVMADLNQIRDDVNARAAASGANDDITALLALTTPISIAQGGTGATTEPLARTALGLGAAAVEGLGDNVVDVGGNLHATTTQHSALITASGAFVVPAGTVSTTLFKFTAVPGGGGGGGSNGSLAPGGGGGGGGSVAWFFGFAAGATVTITIGAPGTAGAAPGVGGTGGATKVTYAAVDIVTCAGGVGGSAGTGGTTVLGGAAGAVTNTAGASGLTLQTGLSGLGGSGSGAVSTGAGTNTISGAGGSSPLGSGGGSVLAGTNGNAGAGFGSGGSGGLGTVNTGGAGAPGAVLIEWTL